MITLVRNNYTDQGTFGTLTFDDFTCDTVERPWDNNFVDLSCIPEGEYTLVHYNSPKFGKVFAVTGGTVSLFPDPNYVRSSVLIHPANVYTQLEGCIALGNALGTVFNLPAVLNSDITIKAFMTKAGPFDNIPFTISSDTGEPSAA